MTVSGNSSDPQLDRLMDFAAQMDADRNAPLHPDLLAYVTEEGGVFGPMLRHPLVYDITLLPGQANRTYAEKQNSLRNALMEEDWHRVVWLHERPYRLRALIEYVTGTDEFGVTLPVDPIDLDALALAAEVWIDSENIEEEIINWRLLLGDLPWWAFLGTKAESKAFVALPWSEDGTLEVWRGGTVGDWSWTTDPKIAEFFARRSGIAPRSTTVHKSECFGYFTRRGESELLVRLTPEREALVYPKGKP